MPDSFYPAISSFELLASTPSELDMGYATGLAAVDDNIQVHVAPSGISARGRYWREGPFLKAVVHVQAAGVSPKTISAEVDLRPIARELRRRAGHLEREGARIGGWPGSFVRAVSKIGKSKLLSEVTNAVKTVAQSKITGAVVGAAAVVFPPVGIPAAAAYATANAALSTLDRAKAIKNEARAVLSNGTSAQKAALASRAGEIRDALTRAANVRDKLREIATRAQQGDFAARKTARIFSHVMAHRRRVEQHGLKLDGKQTMPGLLVTDVGRILPGKWLFAAAAERGAQVLASRMHELEHAPAIPQHAAPLLITSAHHALPPAPRHSFQHVEQHTLPATRKRHR